MAAAALALVAVGACAAWAKGTLGPAAAVGLVGISGTISIAGLVWLVDRRLAAPLVALSRDIRNQQRLGSAPANAEPARHWLEALPRTLNELVAAWRASETSLARASAVWADHGRAAEARLNALLAAIGEGAAFCDTDQRITAYNRHFRDLLGDPPALGRGCRLDQLVDDGPLSAWRSSPPGREHPVYAATTARTTTGHLGVSALTLPGDSDEQLLLMRPWPHDGPIHARAQRRAAIARLRALADGNRTSEPVFHEQLHALLDALARETEARQRLPPLPAARLINRLEARGIAPGMPVTTTRCWLYADIPSLDAALGALNEAFGPLSLIIQRGDDAEWAVLSLLPSNTPHNVSQIETIPVSGLGEAVTVGDIVADHDASLALIDGNQGETRLTLPAWPRTPTVSEVPAPATTSPQRNRRLDSLDYVVFDTETTGLEPAFGDRIVAIGAQRLRGTDGPTETFETLVHPERPIPAASIHYHGITDAMVREAPTAAEALRDFHAFAGNAVLVAHNAAFDMRFLHIAEREAGVRFTNPVLDTLLLSLLVDDQAREHTLEAIAQRLGATLTGRHSALGDAQTTADIFARQIPLLLDSGFTTLGDAERASRNLVTFRRQQRAF